MLKNKKANYDKINTFIAKDVTIDGGRLTANETVRIDGTYIGDIHCEGSICIGDTGVVKGNLTGKNILVGGNVEGNLKSELETHLAATCTVVGDITCGSFIVDEGATFEGHCKMLGNGPSGDKKKKNQTPKKEEKK